MNGTQNTTAATMPAVSSIQYGVWASMSTTCGSGVPAGSFRASTSMSARVCDPTTVVAMAIACSAAGSAPSASACTPERTSQSRTAAAGSSAAGSNPSGSGTFTITPGLGMPRGLSNSHPSVKRNAPPSPTSAMSAMRSGPWRASGAMSPATTLLTRGANNGLIARDTHWATKIAKITPAIVPSCANPAITGKTGIVPARGRAGTCFDKPSTSCSTSISGAMSSRPSNSRTACAARLLEGGIGCSPRATSRSRGTSTSWIQCSNGIVSIANGRRNGISAGAGTLQTRSRRMVCSSRSAVAPTAGSGLPMTVSHSLCVGRHARANRAAGGGGRVTGCAVMCADRGWRCVVPAAVSNGQRKGAKEHSEDAKASDVTPCLAFSLSSFSPCFGRAG